MVEEFSVLSRGLLLGLMLAAPVGPVGLLCIHRTLRQGMGFGLATGLGAAFADLVFSAVAAFGVATVIVWLNHYRATLHILGGGILFVVAWRAWRTALPPEPGPLENGGGGESDPAEGRGGVRTAVRLVRAVGGSFILTLTNPATLVGTLALVATLGGLRTPLEAGNLVAGVFVGSFLWWVILSGGITLVRHHFTDSRVRMINRATAVALTLLGLWALTSGLAGYWVR